MILAQPPIQLQFLFNSHHSFYTSCIPPRLNQRLFQLNEALDRIPAPFTLSFSIRIINTWLHHQNSFPVERTPPMTRSRVREIPASASSNDEKTNENSLLFNSNPPLHEAHFNPPNDEPPRSPVSQNDQFHSASHALHPQLDHSLVSESNTHRLGANSLVASPDQHPAC